jgi:hypothetical protein
VLDTAMAMEVMPKDFRYARRRRRHQKNPDSEYLPCLKQEGRTIATQYTMGTVEDGPLKMSISRLRT